MQSTRTLDPTQPDPTQDYMFRNRVKPAEPTTNDGFRYPDWYYQTGHWLIISCETVDNTPKVLRTRG